MSFIIVAHGGVSTPESDVDGVQAAAEEARRVLVEKGGSALEAAVAAVVLMEDDGRYDAGTGSYYNLEGEIEMDAAVMDEAERCGAVAAIKDVKNPIMVALDLIETPHIMLSGAGAQKFARLKGHAEFKPGTERTRKRLEDVKNRLICGNVHEWAEKWRSYQHPGTVGAVVYDGKGGFGTANSTGGTSYQMSGRVGDSAVIGAGLYASKNCAVGTTGIGEDIIRKVLAKSVFDRIVNGSDPKTACEWGVGLYPASIPMGVIAVTSDAYGIAANDVMPVAVIEE